MKQNFDFEQVGKKVPYQVPEGFFDEMQKNVMEQAGVKKSNKSFMLRFVPIASAVAAVLTAVLYLPLHNTLSSEKSISQATSVDDTWIEHISDEELQLMNNFSDYDIFINE